MALSRVLSVQIEIEQITLEGLGARSGFALKLALERALAQLVSERGVPAGWQHGVDVRDISVPSLQWDGRGGDQGLAVALARELYQELSR